MTLITAVLTERYVALASDRRLSWYVEKADAQAKLMLQEDSDTKVFNLCGYFLMGFTGLARVDGKRMEAWVAEGLADKEPRVYFDTLSREATAMFRRLRLDRKPAHAFLAVGFFRERRSERLIPAQVIVSNSLTAGGDWDGLRVDEDFRVVGKQLGNQRERVVSVGWKIPDRARHRLNADLRHKVRGAPDNPGLIVDALVDATWETALRSNGHVGDTVMVSTLPASAVPASYSSVSFTEPPWRTEPVSCVVRRGAQSDREAQFYLPAIITPEITSIGIEMDTKPLPPPRSGFT